MRGSVSFLAAPDPAMDTPENDSALKDLVLTSLLMLAISGLAYVYRQYQNSHACLRKVISDLDGLSKAEETLKDMQDSLQQQQQQQQRRLSKHQQPQQMQLQQQQLQHQHLQQQQLPQQQHYRPFCVETFDSFTDFLSPESIEVSRLREEVEGLRVELQQAEIRYGQLFVPVIGSL